MSAFLRLLGLASAAAGLILGTLPAFAQTATTPSSCADVRFELANPAPGSQLEPGGLVIEGIAMDSRAVQGTGIDHVDFFLGNRDEGGLSVGTAVPGSGPGPFGTFGSFQTTVTLPRITGGNDLVGYAHSSVTGQEFIISIPVAIGESTTVAGETSANGAVPAMTETCPSTAPTAPVSTMPTTPVTTTPSTSTTTPSTSVTTPTQSMVTFDVANPSAGATINVGAYVIQGIAMDHSAMSGVGIDRVDVFLDNRNEGGMFLGSASLSAPAAGMAPGAWTITINTPNNMKGLHTLWFAAHSSVTGGETTLEIPVDVE